MRNIRAVFVPILLLAALCALAWFDLSIPIIAEFSFIWDVILGTVLGIALAWLPTLSGFTSKRNQLTGMFWVGGFLALLLVFYQYMVLVTGLNVEALTVISSPGPRMRIVEGAFLGYCSFTAGRGKV